MSGIQYTLLKSDLHIAGTKQCKDGIHFGYQSLGESVPSLVLYKKGQEDPDTIIPFQQAAGADGFFSMKLKLPQGQYEYNFMEDDQIVVDPYAYSITGKDAFGTIISDDPHQIRAGIVKDTFSWKEDSLPMIPFHEVIMYHLHVRGFSKNDKSGVRKKGTFAGLKEKIPYLKTLGINQIKLMPVYEFEDMIDFMSDGSNNVPSTNKTGKNIRNRNIPMEDQYRLNYWGYGKGFYFSPKASYAYSDNAVKEFQELVLAMHKAGIEVILEMSFTPETSFQMISDCLLYWAEMYHVDGFSVMVRENLYDEIAALPLFQSRKLYLNWISDAAGKQNARRLRPHLIAESNDGFMNDCRRMLKGDETSFEAFRYRVGENKADRAVVHYMTNHDGFTMQDLVSYDIKHNEDNYEKGNDGTDYNLSWNCGEEGETRKKEILRLRLQQKKNAFAMMLFSQGIPMILAGDEFGNSQGGNNNPYCHDSNVTWLDWNLLRKNTELKEFVRNLISFRKAHNVLHRSKPLKFSDSLSCGYPDLSFHGERAWYSGDSVVTRHLGCLYAGKYTGEDSFLYVAYNMNSVEKEFAVPALPKGYAWYEAVNTSFKESCIQTEKQVALPPSKTVLTPARSVVVLEGRRQEISE